DGYDSAYGWWQAGTGIEGDPVRQVRVRENYRVMWRAMAATTGERTLVSAIFPPGTAGVHSVSSYGLPGAPKVILALLSASTGSLLSDFMIRSSVGSTISPGAVHRLPAVPEDLPLAPAAL